MNKLINRFNTWYDSLVEPKRFYYFLGIVAGPMFITSMLHPLFALAWAALLLYARLYNYYK